MRYRKQALIYAKPVIRLDAIVDGDVVTFATNEDVRTSAADKGVRAYATLKDVGAGATLKGEARVR